MLQPTLLTAFAAAFGLAAGSFANVVMYRLPRRQSLVRPPSTCGRCGRRLRPLELVPVLSYLALRGRCAGCRAPIGWRYPAVEAAAAAVAVAAVEWQGPAAGAGALLAMLAGAWVWAAGQSNRRAAAAGSLLVEIALASALFTLVVTGLFGLFTYGLAETNAARLRVAAINLARSRLEIMRQNPAGETRSATDPDTGATWTSSATGVFSDPQVLDPAGNPIVVQVLTVSVAYAGRQSGRPQTLWLGALRGEQP